MEEQARAARCNFRRGIELVPEDRVADGVQVHAKLVRAAGDRFEFDARGVGRGVTFDHPPSRAAWLAGGAIDDLLRPVRPIRGQGQVDLALVLRDDARHDRDIAFAHFAPRERSAHEPLHPRATSEKKQAGRRHVEPMDDERVGDVLSHTRRRAVGLVGTAPRDRQHPRRFVDDNQPPVGMDQ